MNFNDIELLNNFFMRYKLKKEMGSTFLPNLRFFQDFFKKYSEIKNLSEIRVYFDEVIKKEESKDYRVFEFEEKVYFPFKEQLHIFKKGEWQEYLARVYLSSFNKNEINS